MARMVHDIFLASPFEEFQKLRKVLNIEINKMASRFPVSLVDLNDGAVAHSPPVKECITKARQSDFMILLMGDTYGSYAPNENKSYTHLEYESVIYENSPTIVLVFCIGDSCKNNSIEYSNNISFRNFQKTVMDHHTIGFFSKDQSTEEIGQKIIQELLIQVNLRVQNGHMGVKANTEEISSLTRGDQIKNKGKIYKHIFNNISKYYHSILSTVHLMFNLFIGVIVVFFLAYIGNSILKSNKHDKLIWHCEARSTRASGWTERVGKQNAIEGALQQCEMRKKTSSICQIVKCYEVKK